MAASIAQLQVVVSGDTKDAESKLAGVNDKVKESGGFFKDALKNALSFAAGSAIVSGVGGAVGFVTSSLSGLVQSGIDANNIMAQMAAGLRSTHDASGMTMQSLDALSDSITNQTGISDDAVKASESMLLTFTNIGKNVFPQATQAVADLATKMANGAVPSAQQMEQASIQLGKALGNPLTGFTALQRVGVTFDAQQKEQIKNFMAVGNVAGAQGIILNEMNKEFGGSAAAAGQANGGIAILTAQFDSMKEKVGQAVIPILVGLLHAIEPITNELATILPGAISAVSGWMSTLFGSTQQVTVPLTGMRTVVEDVGGHLERMRVALSGTRTVMKDVQGPLSPLVDLFKSLAGGLGSVVSSLTPVAAHTKTVQEAYSTFKDVTSEVNGHLVHHKELLEGTRTVLEKVPATASPLAGVMSGVGDAITTVVSTLSDLGSAMASTVGPIAQQFGATLAQAAQIAKPVLSGLATIFKQDILPAIKQLLPVVSGLALSIGQSLGNIIKAILPTLLSFGQWFLKEGVPALKSLADFITKNVLPVLSTIVTTVVKDVVPAVQSMADTVIKQVLPAVENLWNVLAPKLVPIIQLLAGILSTVVPIAFKIVATVITDVIGVITTLVTWIGTVIGWFGKMWDFLKQVGNWIGGVFTNTINGISTLFSNVFSGLVSIVKAPFNLIIDALNVLINGLDLIHFNVPSWVPVIGGKGFGFDIPDIPHMATGGTVTTQGIVEVGENGPETLVLPRGAQVIPNVSPAALSQASGGAGSVSGVGGAGGGNGVTQQITIVLDSRMLTEQVLKNLPRAVRIATGLKI